MKNMTESIQIHATQDLYSFVQFITKDMALTGKKEIIGQQKDWNIPFFMVETRAKNAIKWNFGVAFLLVSVWLDEKYSNDMRKEGHCFNFPVLDDSACIKHSSLFVETYFF